MKKYLYLMAALAIAAVSCKKAELVTPSITLSTPTEVTVPTDGGIQTISFTTNVPWKASIDNSNWTVSPTSGDAGTASVKVTAINNTGNDPVVAKVTIKAETASETITFTQLQKDAMIVDVTSYGAPAEGGTVSVKVSANVEVTATTTAEWITIPTPTKGLVEKTFDLTVAANDGEAREGIVVLSGAGQKVEVTISQAAFEPYFEVDCELFEVTKEGGEFTVNINTNVEFTVTDYNGGSFPWQKATLSEDKKTLKVVIDANTDYDVRTSYVKFTSPAIVDEEGAVIPFRVYFYQEGILVLVWRQDFERTPYYSANPYSTALSGDYILVNTSEGIQVFKQSDGTFVQTISTAPFTLTGITNDDAGNVVVSRGGDFPLKEDGSLDADKQIPLTVAYLPAGSLNIADAKTLISSYKDEFWGYGLDNIRVTGDVTDNACITMFSGAGTEGHLVFWEVLEGYCNDAYTDYVTYGGDAWGEGPTGIRTSRHCVGKSLGNAVGTGVFAIGYDGNYNLFYNAGTSMTNWEKVLETGGEGNEGFNAIDYIEWNGHKYASTVMMTYFGKVDLAGDGNYSYCPSYLYLINIDNPEEPVAVSKHEFYMTEDNFVYGSTTDVNLVVEGDDLVVYVLDSGISCMYKVKYPKM